MSLAETIAEIKRQGGLVYVPHPFDRLHSVPDYEHLLDVVEQIDILEVFNPRIAIDSFSEEAVYRAQVRHRPGRRARTANVAHGTGQRQDPPSRFRGPQEFLEAMRAADIVRKHKNLVYVQAPVPPDQRGGAAGRWRPAPARVDARARFWRRAEEEAGSRATDDRRRDPREVPGAGDSRAERPGADLAACDRCPRGSVMPVQGSGHPQADIFMLKHTATSEIEEGVAFYGRAGNALMKSFKRLSIDPIGFPARSASSAR